MILYSDNSHGSMCHNQFRILWYRAGLCVASIHFACPSEMNDDCQVTNEKEPTPFFKGKHDHHLACTTSSFHIILTRNLFSVLHWKWSFVILMLRHNNLLASHSSLRSNNLLPWSIYLIFTIVNDYSILKCFLIFFCVFPVFTTPMCYACQNLSIS